MRIILLIFTMSLLCPVYNLAQSVTINESAGWLESAYVKWQPVANAKSYQVFYTGNSITDQKIDDQLIRSYGTYYRADVLGLKAGTYTLKVVPVFSSGIGSASVTGTLNVTAHDRSGFAFADNRIPGAYKADGTPKDNAVIVYITKNNKDSVSLNVTGATTNPCVGLQTILDGFKKGKDNRPLIVRVVGQIPDLSYMLSGDIVIENNNNASGCITFEGIGDDAVADGWGIRVKNASNIEIRNIGLMNCNSDEGDDIGLQQDNDHIWVHNCDFFYGEAGSDADQIKGDGALDCKKSTYVTFSYNHFWDNGKSNLLGLSEGTTDGLYITYHHNWYDHSDSRHPRVRFYSAHVYNNYYDGNAKYGAGATEGSSVFVEANYFRNCKYPMLISMQGTDVYNETTHANDYTNMPTFSNEDGGIIKAFNNYMTGPHRFVPYGASGYPNSTIDFDAYVATSRNETISNSVVTYQGAHAYNNFDTNSSVMYSYTADSPENAKTKVTQYAGRVNGGDLHWTFDNSVDDASYSVNIGLKNALTNYKTGLILIQGDSTYAAPKDTTTTPKDTTTTPATDVIHNFTVSGKTSTFFTITGNLSTSKGTVMYAGLTLTQCLKIESATGISFISTQEAALTLVFNETFTGKISINGTSYSATNGIITVTLLPDTYTITKVDAANLYYMSLVYKKNTTAPTIISVTPADRCGIGIVTLEAIASAGTIEWYAASTGGLSLGTGNSFTTPEITATTPYYADATNNGVTSVNRTTVIATIHTPPAITAIVPAARAGVGSVTLGATASEGTINWYETATGGTSLGTGTSFTTPGISATTSYFVDATINNCTTAARTEIVATVNMVNPTGIDAVKSTGITLSPNPVTDNLTITSDVPIVRVDIYSITGAFVKSDRAAKKTIAMSNLKPGFYKVMVFTNQGAFTYAVIKK